MPRPAEWSREAVRALARTNRRVFTAGDLQRLLEGLQKANTIPETISARRFTEVMQVEAGLREEEVPSVADTGEKPGPYRAFRRYVIRTASP
ncbi:hypothetical protein, partial [Gemmatimonas sp.]|uniref:hypothetical protein n=1 Tax=Gemmatimonas sp. TaxID=1962908 RepID=UPI0037C03603